MNNTFSVVDEILRQLGGNKFIAMTGSKNFVSDGDTLKMCLVKNISKANMLYITLDDNDTYTMRFIYYVSGRLNRKTFEWIDEKITEVETISGLFAEDLQKVFTRVTGLDTHL